MAEPLEIVAAIEGMLAERCRRRHAARRAPGAGHQRADARADRSGALHLEPFLGQAGPCDRGGAGRARRRHGAGFGADAGAGAGRGQGRAGRDRGGDAGRLRGRAPGRCRGDGGGGRRLAGRERRRAQAQKGRRRPADAAPRREPGHPRPVSPSAPTTGRRWSSALPPRPTTSSPTPAPSARASAATGSSPTTSRPAPAPSAATATRSTWSTPRGSRTGRR